MLVQNLVGAPARTDKGRHSERTDYLLSYEIQPFYVR